MGKHHDCNCCYDTGIIGGDSYPFAFCKCNVGIAREEREPECVNKANELREKLLNKFPHTSEPAKNAR